MKRAQPVSWQQYFENTKGRPPRPLLIKALPYVLVRGSVLDFGAGALNDSIFLLFEGFTEVIALDKIDVAAAVAEKLSADHFKYIISTFELYDFPKNHFDLINAQYALPFIAPISFDGVFKHIHNALKLGGILAGQFFGDRDEWRNNSEMTFKSKEEVEKIIAAYNFEVLSFEEEERDKETAAGEMKHWHVFHVIVRKK